MPNNAYERSVRKERALVNDFREKGWIAARSAGSKSPIDVWAFNPKTKEFKLIQVKTRKGKRLFTIATKQAWNDVNVVFEWHSS